MSPQLIVSGVGIVIQLLVCAYFGGIYKERIDHHQTTLDKHENRLDDHGKKILSLEEWRRAHPHPR